MAECIGGVCRISPVNLQRTSSICGEIGISSVIRRTLHSGSPESVSSPRLSVASYDLAESRRNRENFVASPKTSGRRPVAKGSSVPVWPAFAAARARRAMPSARVEVIPAGLSTSRTPEGGAIMPIARLFGWRASCTPLGLDRSRLHGLVDEAAQAHATLDRLVIGEMQLRHGSGAQAVGQARAQ